ncbi:hypothetical protein Tco_1396219 [Tanacetum coccineum]
MEHPFAILDENWEAARRVKYLISVSSTGGFTSVPGDDCLGQPEDTGPSSAYMYLGPVNMHANIAVLSFGK